MEASEQILSYYIPKMNLMSIPFILRVDLEEPLESR